MPPDVRKYPRTKEVIMQIARKIAVALGVVLAALFLAGIGGKEKVDVRVSAANLNNYQSSLGYLNTGLFDIGKILIFYPEAVSYHHFVNVKVAEADLMTSQSVEKTAESLKSELSFSFSADLKAEIKAEIRNSISNNSFVEVLNYRRLEIRNPLQALEKETEVLERIAEYYEAPEIRFVFIYAVITAQKVQIGYSKSVGAEAAANVMEIGGFSVNVTYEDNSSIERITNGAPAFFKPYFLMIKRDNEGNAIADENGNIRLVIDPDFDLDISKYMGVAPHQI